MTQSSLSKFQRLKAIAQSSRQIKLIGGLSVLGTFVWTQTAVATGSFVIQDPLSAPVTAPPASAPSPSPAPTPVVTPSNVQLAPPQVSVPAPSQAGKNSYVDTTNYSRVPPATSRPAPVVLTERATGCQTVVQSGQLQSGSCGAVTPQAIAARPTQPVASSRPAQLKPVYPIRQAQASQITRRQTVATAVAPPQPLQYNRATERPAAHPGNGNTALLFPLSIPATVSSVFGWRMHPVSGTQRLHDGTDLAAPLGTPVLAAYSGEVAVADALGGYGLTVILRHEQGTQESRYAHLSEIFVRPGDWIEQGTVIGQVGSTGLSTGPHLHFEWRHLTQSGWVAVDAGVHLEYAMENLIRSLEVAQNSAKTGV